jgi:hypothetical protein
MADIDQIIAGGAGASSRADFSGIPKILDSYWAGKDQAAKNDLREAFKGGVPLTPDGQLDTQAVLKTLLQKGDISGATGLIGTAAAAQDRSDYIKSLSPSAPPLVSPSVNRQVPIAGNARTAPQGDQPGSIVGLVSAAGIPDELAGPYIQQISAQTKMDPNAALNPELTQRVQQVAQAAAQRMKGGQQPSAPQQPPQVAQAPQVAPQMQPQASPEQIRGFQPSPAQAAAQNDPELRRLQYFSASPDKAIAASNKAQLEAYLKNKESTNPMKEAAASGLTLQQYQERQGEQAAQQAGASERAKADVAEQNEYIKGGKVASDRLSTLNTISNIISSDKMGLGFGADTQLKVQMALKRFGVDVGDLSGPQAIQKLNAVLASESAKGVGARPTQFEFKTFLANNPGLSMDKAGNERVIGIYSQLAKREVDLGRLARSNQDNWSNWDNVVENYDKKNPIKDPTSGKVITTDSIVAPGPKQAAQPAKQGPSPTFGTKADLHAAIASGKLQKGDSFIGGDGVERTVP